MGSTPSDPVDGTLAYYNEHADAFIQRTAHLPMQHLYELFLALVRERGRILDAGCGSGRDAAEFARLGYDVTASDGSVELAKRASERTGLQVLPLTFEAIEWQEEFDGVWACASLLHLPSPALASAITRLGKALRPGGVLFVSLKKGAFEGTRNARWFTDTTPDALRALLTATGLEVVNIWEADDGRPEVATRWVNGLGRRARSEADQ